MTLTLTDDPIIGLADAMAILEDEDETRLTLLVNSASARFKQYTGRIRITAPSEDITEYTRGLGGPRLYLHATPIVSVTKVDLLSDGAISSTLYEGDDFQVFPDEGLLYRNGDVWRYSEAELNIVVSYQGGWTDVPGDVQMGAVLLMRAERQRYQGEVGVMNITRGGQSASFETSNLPRAVQEAWAPYRIIT